MRERAKEREREGGREREREREAGREREREAGGGERWIESHLYNPELTFLSLIEGSLHYRLVSIIQS